MKKLIAPFEANQVIPEFFVVEVQCTPLNVITSGQTQADNIKRMIIITKSAYT